MLNAWHLPVAPFVKQHNDKLTITLWLSGENPPSRVTLRSEFDNEEISLAMRKQRRQPQPAAAGRDGVASDAQYRVRAAPSPLQL